MANALMTRSVFLTGLLSGAACALLLSPLHAQEKPSPVSADRVRVQKQAEDIVKRYVTLLNQSGLPVTHAPKVVVKTMSVMYTKYPKRTDQDMGDADPTVFVPFWDDMPSEFHSLLDKWATMVEPGMTGRFLFENWFNWYYIPTEMTHFFQDENHVDIQKDHYGSEVTANRVAVAFWLTQKSSRQRLARLALVARRLQQSLPNPVPAGEDPIHYFNANYDMILNTPVYGWFEMKMMADAYDDRETLKFSKMVQDIAKEKP